MTIGSTAHSAFRRIKPEIYREAIVDHDALGRKLRMDSPETLGVSTEWFLVSAFLDGETGCAHDHLDYMWQEFSHIHKTLLKGWLRLLLDHVEGAGWSSGLEDGTLLNVPGNGFWDSYYRLADQATGACHTSIDARNELAFLTTRESLRGLLIDANDLSAHWVQDILTLVADREGAEGVEALIRRTYETIWKDRYSLWFSLNGHERLALSAEGMRPHFSGKFRTGDFEIEETEESYVMVFDPCGTGGVMRRGDEVTGRPQVIPTFGRGTNDAVRDWSWGQTGVSWYCSHCPMLLEWFPRQDFLRIVRPVLFHPDPYKPCRWVVPKSVDPLQEMTSDA
ncbi:MAG: hypothetical protein OXI81_05315 [Paracoccaceae bacterium]|nr:hypothetical protein [Paracoccaceae bacterium]